MKPSRAPLRRRSNKGGTPTPWQWKPGPPKPWDLKLSYQCSIRREAHAFSFSVSFRRALRLLSWLWVLPLAFRVALGSASGVLSLWKSGPWVFRPLSSGLWKGKKQTKYSAPPVERVDNASSALIYSECSDLFPPPLCNRVPFTQAQALSPYQVLGRELGNEEWMG